MESHVHSRALARLLASCLIVFGCASACSRRENLDVSYYYLSLCPSCGETRDEQNLRWYLERASLASRRFKVNMTTYDIKGSANIDRLQRMFEEHQVPSADQRVPIAFAGGKYYAGTLAIQELAKILQTP